MSDAVEDTDELPSTAGDLAAEFPEVWDEYAALGKACSEAGPIEGEEKRLVKLALAAGAGSEGAVHSHVRRALEEGVDPEALRHVALLAVPTIGFPKAVAALTWIDDIVERRE
ncbi:carboxymuconolactone decarboxylase family protein [Halorubrum salsamenti]|uniref:carboxymuconolactone decarboxylase family protein n=1 Tax=Halorubrum salsamenti TaxID=2583990 RepID=UPI0011AA28E5|nr:carboxymuconolactone decarboxylase family protein [Halorubrum salsamenti]